MARIAFLGLGNMGKGMAENLLAAGHCLTVFNRTPEKAIALVERGALLAGSPRDAAADADAIISMVTNDEASRSVWLGDQGALHAPLRAGTLAIESSTLSRPWILQLAAEAKARQLRFLDCPVAGRPDVAASGQLAVFAGGAEDDVEAARPLLLSFGKSVTRFGPVGSGIAFKLIYNVLGATQVAAVAEAMAACSAVGIDLAAAAESFASGATGSAHVVRHAKAMSRGEYDRPVQFTPSGRVKDLTYGIELARTAGVQAAMAEAARFAFQEMVNKGVENCNDTELFEFLRGRRGGSGI